MLLNCRHSSLDLADSLTGRQSCELAVSYQLMPYKRFYPGAQREIGEGRKEIRGELGAGSEMAGSKPPRSLSGRQRCGKIPFLLTSIWDKIPFVIRLGFRAAGAKVTEGPNSEAQPPLRAVTRS